MATPFPGKPAQANAQSATDKSTPAQFVGQTEAERKLTPERIFSTLSAYEETEVLKSAIELDVFTAIGEGVNTAAALAAKVGAAERGVRILCDHLTIQGFLNKEANRYSLTEESATFLDRRSPKCVASMTGFLTLNWHKRNFENLTTAVRTGSTAGDNGDCTKPNDELWVAFARCMAPLTVPAAQFICGLVQAQNGAACKVLDVAAGHGMYGISIARKNPNAHVVALDWPQVLEVAQENARTAGVESRYTLRPGSALEADLGSGYDYVLLTNIFHHFDVPTCEKLMERVYTALKPGGKAVTLEFVPNEDRVTPPAAARFAIVMLANTIAGDAYTFSEYEKMFRNAGFAKSALHPINGMPQQVLVSEKTG
jgi:2-polyprenyl-3-methyl-5-hydroxy-6-metoxy-1,4-benzoquinol methylase